MIRLMEEIQHYLSYTSAADPKEAASHVTTLDDVKASWKNAQFVVEEQAREIKRLETELRHTAAEKGQLYADAERLQTAMQVRINELLSALETIANLPAENAPEAFQIARDIIDDGNDIALRRLFI